MEASERQVAIDWVKAAAILAVVWIHAYLTLARPEVGLVHFLGSLARFAVPAFLFASGFLAYRPEPLDTGWLGRRLSRLLVPYFVASGIAFVGLSLAVAPIGWSRIGWDLLTGDAVGIYYFMVPLVVAVFVAMLASRIPRHLPLLVIVLAVCAWLCEAFVIPIPGATPDATMFWHRRNPLHWLAYYALGWLVAAQAGRLAGLRSSSRRAVGAALLLAAVVAAVALAGRPALCCEPQPWYRCASTA